MSEIDIPFPQSGVPHEDASAPCKCLQCFWVAAIEGVVFKWYGNAQPNCRGAQYHVQLGELQVFEVFPVLGQIGARIRLRRCSTMFRSLQMSVSTFCKTACGAQFPSLENGRDCSCTPQFHNHKGGNVDATQHARVNRVNYHLRGNDYRYRSEIKSKTFGL